jgi:hypothetical protein
MSKLLLNALSDMSTAYLSTTPIGLNDADDPTENEYREYNDSINQTKHGRRKTQASNHGNHNRRASDVSENTRYGRRIDDGIDQDDNLRS